MRIHRVQTSILLLALATAPIARAQQLPPVRPLGATTARSTEPMGSVSAVRHLPGGKALVNDILKRRVLLFDSTLSQVTVVADSTASTANAYGGRTGGLIAYRGDSTLFVDPASLSMLVIDGGGKITRVMSAPRPNDVPFLIGGPNGAPGFDAKGRLVYRGQARPLNAGRGAIPAGPGGATFALPQQPDSAPVVRFDLETRTLDTAGFFKIPRNNVTVTQTANGGFAINATINPLPITDDWALLSEGTIAFVRGADYHVDWVRTDGSRTSSAKIPYEWQRLDDDAKSALLDSARTAMEKAREMAMANAGRGGGAMPMGFDGGRGGDATFVVRGGGGAGAPAPTPPPRPAPGDSSAGRGAAAPGALPSIQLPPINMVSASELPDYRPPFNAGSARGDLDGNLWVRTTSPVGNEGPVYYVINRQGEVIDRVQVPQGRLIVGFGPGGVVYMALRDADGNARVERANVKAALP